MKEINLFLSGMIAAVCVINLMLDHATRKDKSESIEEKTRREFEEDVAEIERWLSDGH